MINLFEGLYRNYLKHIVNSLLFGAIAFLFMIPQLKFDHSDGSWFQKDDPVYTQYQTFLDQFGSDEFVVIGWHKNDNDLNRAEYSKTINQLIQDLNSIPHIENVGYPYPGLSNDVEGVFLIVHPGDKFTDYRKEISEGVRKVLADFKTSKIEFHLLGIPILDTQIDLDMGKDFGLFFSLTLLVISLFIFLLYRSFRILFLVIGVIGLSMIYTLGLMPVLGFNFTLANTILPVLLIILGIMDSIHILNHCAKYPESIKKFGPLKRVLTPCLITSLTTSIGFASLLSSPIPAIRELGIVAAIGTIITFIVSITVIPFVLGKMDLTRIPSLSKPNRVVHFILDQCFVFTKKFYPFILAAFAMIFVLGMVRFSMPTIATDWLSFFKEKSTIQNDYRFFRQNFGSVSTLEVIVSPKDTPESTLKKIESLKAKALSLPTVTNVIVQNSPPQSINPTDIRITLLTTTLASNEVKIIMDELQPSLNQLFPHSAYITGINAIFVHMAEDLVESLVKSFSISFFAIFCIMFFYFGFKLGLLSIIVNLFPVLSIFGIMRILDITLDIGTVLTACITLGIIVDDTIHFASAIQANLKEEGDPLLAVKNALHETGYSIIITTLILTVGFSVLLVSSFKPVINFGILTSISFVLALIADLFISSSMIIALRHFFKQNR